MGQNGGARPGSGMKPGQVLDKTLEKRAKQAAMIEYFMSKMPELHAALYNKALTGDVPAIKEIHERVYGKVTEHLDHTTDGRPFIELSEDIAAKYALNTIPKDDSSGSS